MDQGSGANGGVVGAIGRITPVGVITEFPAPTGSVPIFGITAGPDGNVWFTEQTQADSGGAIGRITPEGSITEFPLPMGYASGITAGADGNLWFATTGSTNGEIGRMTLKGVIREFPLPQAHEVPWLLRLDRMAMSGIRKPTHMGANTATSGGSRRRG